MKVFVPKYDSRTTLIYSMYSKFQLAPEQTERFQLQFPLKLIRPTTYSPCHSKRQQNHKNLKN